MVYNELDVMWTQIDPWEEGEVRKNIFVMPSKICDLFVEKVTKNIEKIEENPVGNRLLEKISHCKISIIIQKKHTEINNKTGFLEGEEDNVVSVIEYLPSDKTCLSSSMEEIPLPSDVMLFHELVHAYHLVALKKILMSSYCDYCDPIVWSRDEEYRTIMGFPFEEFEEGLPPITENAYRKAANLPERFSHHSMETLTPFISERIKLLGSIHQRNIALNKESIGPPPVALCSEVDFTEKQAYLLLEAVLKGLDADLNPTDDPNPTTLYSVTKLDSWSNRPTYIYSAGGDSIELKILKYLLINTNPNVVDKEFELLSGNFLRISEREREMIKKKQ